MTWHIGKLPVGPPPRVVGTLSSVAALEKFARVPGETCDIAEVRLDRIGPAATDWLGQAKAIEARGVPVILTLRLAADGGAWRRPDEERAGYFSLALENLAAIDVELQSRLLPRLAAAARQAGKTLIGSHHDFTKTPSVTALETLILEASRQVSVVKLATMITKPSDVATLGGLLERDWGVPL